MCMVGADTRSFLIFFIVLPSPHSPHALPNPARRLNVPAQDLTCFCICEEEIDVGLLVSIAIVGHQPKDTHQSSPTFWLPWFKLLESFTFPFWRIYSSSHYAWLELILLFMNHLFSIWLIAFNPTHIGSNSNLKVTSISASALLSSKLSKTCALHVLYFSRIVSLLPYTPASPGFLSCSVTPCCGHCPFIPLQFFTGRSLSSIKVCLKCSLFHQASLILQPTEISASFEHLWILPTSLLWPWLHSALKLGYMCAYHSSHWSRRSQEPRPLLFFVQPLCSTLTTPSQHSAWNVVIILKHKGRRQDGMQKERCGTCSWSGQHQEKMI